MLAPLLAIVALLALVLPLRTRRAATPILALVIGFAATGCDGCSPHSSPGPLRPDENTRFYVNDRLASTALVTDYQGRVIAREAHKPFGDPWVQWRAPEQSPTAYGFTGKERESVTGAISVGIRHYLPALGRWASPDPLVMTAPAAGEFPTSERNPLAFAANNPIRAADRSGLCVGCKVEHQIKRQWTPELRAAHTRYERKQRKEAVRTLDTVDRVLTDLEFAMTGLGPPGVALAGVEYTTLHMAVKAARLLARAGQARRVASAIRTLRIPKSVGADVKLVRVRHYTRKNKLKLIKNDNLLKAGDKGSVFATSARKKPISSMDAQRKLGVAPGNGGAYVEFDASPMEFSIKKNPGTQFREFVFDGHVDLTGRNPTFHKNN